MTLRRWVLPVAALAVAAAQAVTVSGSSRTFVDSVSGVSYPVPEGWAWPRTRDLIGLFTSATAPDATEEQGVVFAAGRFADTFYDPARGGLARETRGTAISYAEFFVPFEGRRDVLLDEAARLGGTAAWRVRLRIVTNDPDAAGSDGALVEVLAVTARPARYLVAVYRTDEHQRVVDGMLRGARLTPAFVDPGLVDEAPDDAPEDEE